MLSTLDSQLNFQSPDITGALASPNMSQAFRPEPELVCSQCGQPDAHAVGDEILCAGCCHVRGSCGAVRETEPSKDAPSAEVKNQLNV